MDWKWVEADSSTHIRKELTVADFLTLEKHCTITIIVNTIMKILVSDILIQVLERTTLFILTKKICELNSPKESALDTTNQN